MAGSDLGGMPVSAPGAASTRTDRQPIRDIPAAFYGDGQQMHDLQAAAPMYQAPKRPTGLFAPSERPHEPVTSGVDFGPGPGSEAIAPSRTSGLVQAPTLAGTLQKLSAASPENTDRLATLLSIAQKNGW